MDSWMVVLSLLGALQGILLSILLFTRKENRGANFFLALFTLLFALGLLERFLEPYHHSSAVLLVSNLLGGTSFLYGPLIYCYVYQLLKGKMSRKWLVVHLTPFFIYSFLLLLLYLSGQLKNADQPGEGLLEVALLYLLFGQMFFYSFLSLRLIFSAEKIERELKIGVSIQWLKSILISLTALYLFSFLAMSLAINGFTLNRLLYPLVQIGCVALLYLFSYFALLQPQWIYAPLATSPVRKYQGSSLNDKDKSEFARKIQSYIEKEKLYLNPNLTIESLADTLNINRYYISQVINEQMGKNFSDFINHYRVEETKALLQDPKKDHYKILAIGYEAGFNSKTTFNTTFKKFTGMSPSQYRKQQSYSA